jgi:hypothetical protein
MDAPFPEPIIFKRPFSWRFTMVMCCLLIPVAIALAVISSIIVTVGIKQAASGTATFSNIGGLALFAVCSVIGWGFPAFTIWQMRYWKTPLAIVSSAGILSPIGPHFVSWSNISRFFVWRAQGQARLTIEKKVAVEDGAKSQRSSSGRRQVHFWIGSMNHPLVAAIEHGVENTRL